MFMTMIADTGAGAETGTRPRIRAAARSLIAERGFEAVSMRDIARRVGVRPSAIYNHFESKQALLADLMVAHMERTLAALDRALPCDAAPRARLAAFARFHVGYHLDEPEDVFVAYMELRSLDAANRAVLGRMRDRYERVLCRILQEGIAADAFAPADPRIEARALIAMMTGVTVWFQEDGRIDRAEVVEHYVKIVLRSVGAAAPGEET